MGPHPHPLSGVEAEADEATDLYEDMLLTSDSGNMTFSLEDIGEGSPNSLGSESNPRSPPGTLFPSPACSPRVKYQSYIGNLTWWTTDQDIRKTVLALGVTDTLDVKFHENRNNGQSKGFCVITVSSEVSLKLIHEKLGKTEINGQAPVVKYISKQALAHMEAMAMTRTAAGVGNNGIGSIEMQNQSGGSMHMEMPMTAMRGPVPPHMEMGYGHGPSPGRPRSGSAPASPRGTGTNSPGRPHTGPGYRGMGPNMQHPRFMSPPGPGQPWPQQQYPPYPMHSSHRVPMMFDPRFRGGGPGPLPLLSPMGPRGPMPPMMGPRGPMYMPQHHGDYRPHIPPQHMQGPPRGAPAPHLNPAFMHPGECGGGGPPPGAPYMGDNTDTPDNPSSPRVSAPPPLSEADFDEIMSRNRMVSSSAITRAVSDASTGEFASAIETLVTAISLIKQSRVAYDDRCKILVSSLHDTLHGIEDKSYGSGRTQARDKIKEHSPERDHRRRSRRERSRSHEREYRERSPERYRDYSSRPQERSGSQEYRKRPREESTRPHHDDRYRLDRTSTGERDSGSRSFRNEPDRARERNPERDREPVGSSRH